MYFKIVESELQDAHSNEGVQWRNISHSLLFYTHHCAHTHWMWNGGMKFDSLFHYLKLLRGDLKLISCIRQNSKMALKIPTLYDPHPCIILFSWVWADLWIWENITPMIGLLISWIWAYQKGNYPQLGLI